MPMSTMLAFLENPGALDGDGAREGGIEDPGENMSGLL